ncbi:Domain of unknown function DUF336 [Phaffia rhodozyma]|uniref:DUF967 domain protein n=1 Tax=Phaffia rhodozyma TaxID=264483 RepID=A0A0F7SJG4_PHARH|nr:Domain of unknown function DUF336 [Phaffia rhodozyma]
MSFIASELAEQEKSLVLSSFDSNVAFEIGTRIRSHIQSTFPNKPQVIIQITADTSTQLYFFATVGQGTLPDNAHWAERKRKSVCRWKTSTASLRIKYKDGMPEKYGTFEAEYATHGGGFPLRVKGVEPLVGVVIVSGLAQEEDHQSIVDVLRKYIEEEQKTALS